MAAAEGEDPRLVRHALPEGTSSRDATKDKGGWGTNIFLELPRVVKRPGMALNSTRTSPGQGLWNYSAALVSVSNDVLKVGANTFTL